MVGVVPRSRRTFRGHQSTFRDAAVKAYLDEFANAGPINGVVLVGQQGRVVAAGAYGKANFAYDTPNALDTRFEIASITKTFTAQLVMKLVNEGKIQLSSTIRTYLPGFPAGWADRVTIGQLLTHTAGVQGDIADFPTTGHNFPGVVAQINADLFSLDELLKLVAAPAALPGGVRIQLLERRLHDSGSGGCLRVRAKLPTSVAEPHPRSAPTRTHRIRPADDSCPGPCIGLSRDLGRL